MRLILQIIGLIAFAVGGAHFLLICHSCTVGSPFASWEFHAVSWGFLTIILTTAWKEVPKTKGEKVARALGYHEDNLGRYPGGFGAGWYEREKEDGEEKDNEPT